MATVWIALVFALTISQIAQAQPSFQRLAVVFEPPSMSYARVAETLLESTRIMTVRASSKELRNSLLEIEKAAQSGVEAHLMVAIANLGQILRRGGFDPEIVAGYEEAIVISWVPIPIDLINVGGQSLGRRLVISHIVAPGSKRLKEVLKRALRPERSELKRMALLAVANLSIGVGRENHDIVKAALKFSNRIPTDIVIEPEATESLRYLGRKDVQILHVDTHGDQNGIQLGSRDQGLFHVDQLAQPIGSRFLLLVGCSTGRGEKSLGPSLVARGAAAVVGMAFAFRSGEPSGGDITDSRFYEILWDNILLGLPVGKALLRAKQALPEGPWSSMWLLFGNPHVNFGATVQ